jgi:hypothetical protein
MIFNNAPNGSSTRQTGGPQRLLLRALLPGAALVCAVLAAPLARAGLGEAQSSIDSERVRLHARHAVAHVAYAVAPVAYGVVPAPQYSVHALTQADGSVLQQYVGSDGRVFALRWNTLYKPDLSALLGTSFPAYAAAAQQAAQRGGIQRQFRHEGSDLVLQSTGHLHVFSGYAYRRSLLPRGLSVQSLGLG